MSLEKLIRQTLAEDRTDRDLTCLATVPSDLSGRAEITAKEAGVISGIDVARTVFTLVDKNIEQNWKMINGTMVKPGDVIGLLQGKLRSILTAERTALNFLQHLSGIATSTHSFCREVRNYDCLIADTRKTAPGLRQLEKRAVKHGGGVNHRIDLADGMLIKENHIMAAGSLKKAILACRRISDVRLEVECETLEEVREAIACKPDMILLDNMSVEQVEAAHNLVPESIVLEASGGITIDNAGRYAETGVDRLAIGAITHSASALDISLLVKEA
ncbi:MAG: carboxylating nicotinate-nucleotide diphosphorylase [Mariprofundaceae bacterium]